MKRQQSTLHLEDLSNLPFGEQLILWSIRLWVQGFKTNNKTDNMLAHGLKLAGVSTAFNPLDRFLTIIATSASRDVEVNCIGCSVITLDEHVLICLLYTSPSPRD